MVRLMVVLDNLHYRKLNYVGGASLVLQQVNVVMTMATGIG